MKLILTGRSKTTTPLKSMESNTGQTLSLKKRSILFINRTRNTAHCDYYFKKRFKK